MFCQNCGTKLPDDAKFCTNCGCSITLDSQGVSPTTQQQNTSQAKPDDVLSQVDRSQAESRVSYVQTNSPHIKPSIYGERATAFIGKNASYYIQKFDIMRATGGNKSWNWASFFFTTYWAFYRKMYKVGAILLGIQCCSMLLTLLSSVIGDTATIIGNTITLGMAIVMGIFGTHFYQEYVDNCLAESSKMDTQQWMFYANKEGGTSVVSALIPLVVIIVVMILIFAIMAMAITNMFFYW